jgi:hypothetical protein
LHILPRKWSHFFGYLQHVFYLCWPVVNSHIMEYFPFIVLSTVYNFQGTVNSKMASVTSLNWIYFIAENIVLLLHWKIFCCAWGFYIVLTKSEVTL